MIKKTLSASLLVVALTVGAAACSAADVKQAKFESQLVDKSGLTKAQAKCASTALYKKYDQKTLNKLYTANDPKELPAGVEDGFTKIVKDCVTAN